MLVRLLLKMRNNYLGLYVIPLPRQALTSNMLASLPPYKLLLSVD